MAFSHSFWAGEGCYFCMKGCHAWALLGWLFGAGGKLGGQGESFCPAKHGLYVVARIRWPIETVITRGPALRERVAFDVLPEKHIKRILGEGHKLATGWTTGIVLTCYICFPLFFFILRLKMAFVLQIDVLTLLSLLLNISIADVGIHLAIAPLFPSP